MYLHSSHGHDVHDVHGPVQYGHVRRDDGYAGRRKHDHGHARTALRRQQPGRRGTQPGINLG